MIDKRELWPPIPRHHSVSLHAFAFWPSISGADNESLFVIVVVAPPTQLRAHHAKLFSWQFVQFFNRHNVRWCDWLAFQRLFQFQMRAVTYVVDGDLSALRK